MMSPLLPLDPLVMSMTVGPLEADMSARLSLR
jgi:hypothetical protein